MFNNIIININYFFFNFSFSDYAFPGQYGFQFPSSKLMHGIVNLHHHIVFYLVIIVFFVFTLLVIILESFSLYSFNEIKNYLKLKKIYNVDIAHHSLIEII